MLFYTFLACFTALYAFWVYCISLHTNALKSGLFLHLPLQKRFLVYRVFKNRGFKIDCSPYKCGSINIKMFFVVVRFQPYFNEYTKHLLRA